VDELDENSIADKHYLCHMASKITAEFEDEVQYIFYILYVIMFLFSAKTN